jgi:hypothetical protein
LAAIHNPEPKPASNAAPAKKSNRPQQGYHNVADVYARHGWFLDDNAKTLRMVLRRLPGVLATEQLAQLPRRRGECEPGNHLMSPRSGAASAWAQTTLGNCEPITTQARATADTKPTLASTPNSGSAFSTSAVQVARSTNPAAHAKRRAPISDKTCRRNSFVV